MREPICCLSSGRLPASLALQNKLSPGLSRVSSRRSFTNGFCEDLHPAFLVGCTICIEVNHLAVTETDAEPLFHKHIPFLLFSKCGFASLSATRCGLFLCQSCSIINEFGGLGQVDGCTRLTGGFMVSSQFRSLKFEEAATPVLFRSVNTKYSLGH